MPSSWMRSSRAAGPTFARRAPAGKEVEADDDASIREPVPAERLAHRPQGYKGSSRSSHAVRLRVRSAQALAAAEILALGLSIPDVLAEVTGQSQGSATKASIEAVQQGLALHDNAAA